MHELVRSLPRLGCERFGSQLHRDHRSGHSAGDLFVGSVPASESSGNGLRFRVDRLLDVFEQHSYMQLLPMFNGA